MVFRKRDATNSSVSSSTNTTTTTAQKPLPLKQRTSSRTDRRDFTNSTWISLLQLIKFREYFIPVNHFSIWRRHNAWAFEDGKDLRAYISQRYASNMVFMSLLLSTEFGVLFNSSTIAVRVRDDLVEAHYGSMSFWAGLCIIISSLCTILSLISTFTFTAMISAVDERNAHCILRSSIGQYATELPGRLIVCSIYTFLISFLCFFFILLPVGPCSICLLLTTVFFFVHVVSVFSSFGRIIMHTGAMGTDRIFSSEYEELLVPHSLHNNLLAKAKCNLAHKTSIIRQYRRKQRQIDRFLLEDELYDHINGTIEDGLRIRTTVQETGNSANGILTPRSAELHPNRQRADSKVRFADEEVGNQRSDKEVIGGTIPGSTFVTNGVPSPNHFRSLTPLSDLSDASDRPPMGGRSTLQRDMSSLAVPPKKFFSTRQTSEVSALSSLQNVSECSLEQWLQGSTTTDLDDAQDRKEIGAVMEPRGLPPVVPPQAVSVSKPSLHRSTKTNTSNDVETTTARIRGTNEESTKSPPSRNVYERQLSEEESFNFDYGDFATERSEGGMNGTGYGTNQPIPSHDRFDTGSERHNSIVSMKTERTRLLK